MNTKKGTKSKKVIPKYSTKDFYLDDQSRSLFPLSTNRVLVENGEKQIIDYINTIVEEERTFLPQKTVHANKDRFHLRRTVKLDVVAEYFIYDLVRRNRLKFKKPHSDKKRHYGYRFEAGRPQPPSESYKGFKSDIWIEGIISDKQYLSFDISSYFNSVYHHDLHAWFSALEPEDSNEINVFGRF